MIKLSNAEAEQLAAQIKQLFHTHTFLSTEINTINHLIAELEAAVDISNRVRIPHMVLIEVSPKPKP